jgi:methanogenic corrinoid protein MtbC1
MKENDIPSYKNTLVNMIVDAQRSSAVEFVSGIASRIGFHNAINKVLEPALIEIGEMWSKEKLSLAQGYVAAKITEDILLIAVESKDWHTKSNNLNTPVILANIEDDFHSLGRKMVGTFLSASGWKVIDMGNDVRAKEIVDKAVELNAPIIGVSAMMYTSAINIKNVRAEIDGRHLKNKIKLAVGGAIFKVRPKLVAEVGGDGTASSAMEVPKLFSDLLKTIKF